MYTSIFIFGDFSANICAFKITFVYAVYYLSQIKQGDVDFHQYYSNGKLEDLKYRMDQKQYPPRCKVTVVAKHKNFFVKAHRKITIQCTCNTKYSYKGKVSIPCTSDEGIIITL